MITAAIYTPNNNIDKSVKQQKHAAAKEGGAMSAKAGIAGGCPVQADHTDSKMARMAAEWVVPEPGSRLIRRFADLRRILRSASSLQSGVEVAPVEQDDPTRASIFFLDGEAHAKRRAAIGGFFTSPAIAKLHMPVMLKTADALIGEFRRKGRARLDDLSLRLAVAVAAKIVGLTNSNIDRMASRIEKSSRATMAARGGIWKVLAGLLARFYGLQVFYFDVRPAVAARRANRMQDVISRLLDEGRSEKEILVECLTFGLAGMTTTREFMVMAAWHLFEREDLRRRFLDGDDAEKMAILLEILRLEPVASMIYRTRGEDVGDSVTEPMTAGTRVSLCIRDANLDESVVGPNPTTLDPDRARRLNIPAGYMSFGDGDHRCPGSQVALTETRVFLDKLFRVPGIRLVRSPDIRWAPPMLMSYELRNAIIACERNT
jgi:cytochrome P450